MARPQGDRAGLDLPARSDTAGLDVFISHVEEDEAVALQLADALDAAGYSTWTFERDSVPGPSYLLQTSRAIEVAQAVVVLISPDALGSHQVTSEVVRAHEEVKPFIPLLIGISREEFSARQPEWREAIASAATLEVPAAGVAAVVPRIVEGLVALGIRAHEPGAPRARVSYGARPVAATLPGLLRRRRLLPVVVAVIVVLAAIVGIVLALTGGDGGTPSTSTSSTGPTAGPSADTSSPGAPATSAAPKDAATTPLSTAQGPAKVVARATGQYCDLTNQCYTAPNGRVFVLIDVTAWNGGDLIYDTSLSTAASTSYVAYQGQRASGDHSMLLEGSPAGMTVVYASFPPEVAGQDVNLFWPQNPALRVHVKK